jgi:hypothetical protein
MLLEKVIEVTIPVRNPINFCADKGRHLMVELRNTYEGRCFRGVYIVAVKSILRASACNIEKTNANGEAYVDVQFLADVVYFGRWDILVGVVVASHQQMVVGTYEAPAGPGSDPEAGEGAAPPGRGARPKTVVSILASKSAEALAVGQKIPVRVVVAEHQPLRPEAAVIGTLLVSDQTAPAYRLEGALDAAARAELAPLLEVIDVELEARAALVQARKADLWFFELLLYAYRGSAAPADRTIAAGEGAPAWTGPEGLRRVEAGAEEKNVLEIARRAVAGESVPVAGYWSRSLAIYRSSPLAARAASPPDGWAPPVDGAPRAVFALYLKNILDFLVATREMVELYDTPEVHGAHRNVWAAMRAAQKPA